MEGAEVAEETGGAEGAEGAGGEKTKQTEQRGHRGAERAQGAEGAEGADGAGPWSTSTGSAGNKNSMLRLFCGMHNGIQFVEATSSVYAFLCARSSCKTKHRVVVVSQSCGMSYSTSSLQATSTELPGGYGDPDTQIIMQKSRVHRD